MGKQRLGRCSSRGSCGRLFLVIVDQPSNVWVLHRLVLSPDLRQMNSLLFLSTIDTYLQYYRNNQRKVCPIWMYSSSIHLASREYASARWRHWKYAGKLAYMHRHQTKGPIRRRVNKYSWLNIDTIPVRIGSLRQVWGNVPNSSVDFRYEQVFNVNIRSRWPAPVRSGTLRRRSHPHGPCNL